jgi:hypothetical protein
MRKQVFILFIMCFMMSLIFLLNTANASIQKVCPHSTQIIDVEECVDEVVQSGGGRVILSSPIYFPVNSLENLEFRGVENIIFDCNGFQNHINGGESAIGFYIINSRNITIINCSMSNFSGFFIYIEGSRNITVNKSILNLNQIYHNAFGIDFDYGTYNTSIDQVKIIGQGVGISVGGGPPPGRWVNITSITNTISCPETPWVGIDVDNIHNPNGVLKCLNVSCDVQVGTQTCCDFYCNGSSKIPQIDQCSGLTWYNIQNPHNQISLGSCNLNSNYNCVTNQSGGKFNYFCLHNNSGNYTVPIEVVSGSGNQQGIKGFFAKIWNFLTGGAIWFPDLKLI